MIYKFTFMELTRAALKPQRDGELMIVLRSRPRLQT